MYYLNFLTKRLVCMLRCSQLSKIFSLLCSCTQILQSIDVKNGRNFLARSFHIICTEKIAILFLRCNVFDSKMLIFYTESFVKKIASRVYFAFLFWCQQYVKSFILYSILFIEGTLNTNRYFLLIWFIRQSYSRLYLPNSN